jgi:DNA-binding transcriptional MerR regulator
LSKGETVAAGLNIAALARRTGVAPDTLRKWEQRYGILKPTRTAGGQRRYSERDVARVLWLRARLDEGYRIGEAAALLGPIETADASSPPEQVDAIIAAAAAGDQTRVGFLLDQVFALTPLAQALDEVIAPLVHRTGDEWREGRLTVAQEHLLSEAVRARLAQLVADPSGGIRGIAVLTCAPGERHELGLMMAAVALRSDGWQIVYLGADTPLDDATRLCDQIEARVLGISLALPERARELEGAVAATSVNGTQLVIGGTAASAALAQRVGAVYADPDLAKAVRALRALAA